MQVLDKRMVCARTRVRVAAADFLALAVIVGFCCASAKVKPVEGEPESTVAQPGVVLVYDFAAMPGDGLVPTFGSEFEGQRGEEQDARATASLLSEELVADLQKRGIHAKRGSPAISPPLNAILIKGQFVTIEEEGANKRMVIGFGDGSELRVMVQVFQATTRGLRRVTDAEAGASGSKMQGTVLSAVIRASLAIARDTKGAMAPDVGRLAKKIAEYAEAFFKRQGWH